ncbi:SLAM family member 5 [Python bivittatus]|uniref:SLAM family member 5 n=1 Tax=Python bivittatus TaxID=176946 RepID=A0A9F2NR72_PYTBI|nr:SLAM family member 5 [Python bivittatus]
MSPCALLAFLLFHLAGAAVAPVPAWKAIPVGGSITLPVTVPKGASVNNLLLRSASRGEGIAIWLSSKVLTVVSMLYAGRVAFLEDKLAFKIARVSLDDGGTYEISTNMQSSEKTLGSFTVAVFNINKTVNSLDNSSCTIDLLCEAGMGPRNKVTYSWKDRDTGATLAQGPLLQWIVHTNNKVAYTCTAQILTTQSAMDVVLEQPCIQSSAVPGRSVLGLVSLLARGLLVPAVTAAVLLL